MKQRILGIDPGLQRTGFGLIDQDGARLRYVSSGVIKTESRAGLAQRIQTIVQGIASISHEAQPDCAAVDIVFVNVNPQSTLLLGQARGAALAALVLAQLPVHEYTALQVKQATVGMAKPKRNRCRTWSCVYCSCPRHHKATPLMRWRVPLLMRTVPAGRSRAEG